MSQMRKRKCFGEYFPGIPWISHHIQNKVKIQGTGARLPLVAHYRLVVVDRRPDVLDFHVFPEADPSALFFSVQEKEI